MNDKLDVSRSIHTDQIWLHTTRLVEKVFSQRFFREDLIIVIVPMAEHVL